MVVADDLARWLVAWLVLPGPLTVMPLMTLLMVMLALRLGAVARRPGRAVVCHAGIVPAMPLLAMGLSTLLVTGHLHLVITALCALCSTEGGSLDIAAEQQGSQTQAGYRGECFHGVALAGFLR